MSTKIPRDGLLEEIREVHSGCFPEGCHTWELLEAYDALVAERDRYKKAVEFVVSSVYRNDGERRSVAPRSWLEAAIRMCQAALVPQDGDG
jgi:hypothetical protein